MNKSDITKKIWEEDRKIYLETDLKITKEVVKDYFNQK